VLDKPTGSSAALSNKAIAAPNLLNIDTPGSVVVFVQVADNRFNAGLTNPWEHATNEPYVSVADPRSAPDSAFVAVSVKTEHLDAEIPGAWERNWRAKYGDLVGKVDAEVGDLAPLTAGSTSDASALHTHETIPVTEIGELAVTGDIELVNSAFPTTPAVLTGDYDSNTCAHLNGVADKDIILQRLATLGSGFAKIHMKNGAVEISGGLAAESDLTTDWIQSRSTNGQVTVRGRGTHDADLRTDIIQSDANNAGVTIKRRGTSDHDLRADIIQAASTNSHLQIVRRGNAVCDLEVSELKVERINEWIQPKHQAFPVYNQHAPYTTQTLLEETIWEIRVPPLAFFSGVQEHGGLFRFEFVVSTTASTDNKVLKLTATDGLTPITLYTRDFNGSEAANNTEVLIGVETIISDVANLRVTKISGSPTPGIDVSAVLLSLDILQPYWYFSVTAHTPDNIGDLTLVWSSLKYEPPVPASEYPIPGP